MRTNAVISRLACLTRRKITQNTVVHVPQWLSRSNN
jgi:hypothetical protein